MFRAHTRSLLACLAVILASSLVAQPTEAAPLQIPISEWRLDNGMRVLFAPHRRVPGVTVQVWYHTGSKNEQPGIRGIAHLFEHMMFKGSKHVPPEAHARMLSAIGGNANAFTSEDVTAYHATVPSQYLGFAMRLEAERMRNLHLTLHTIRTERQVVQEEKRLRLENSPIGRALEAIRELAYTRHPYAWTPAGKMKDLRQISRADCQQFYDRYYVPRNATLIVVGDVTEEEVRRAAKEHFGKIPAGPEAPAVTAVEPPQQQRRVRQADWPSQLKVVLGAYHVPAARHADIAPLKVLSAILSAGQSSRLHQELVRKGKLAVAAGGFVMENEHPGVLLIYGVGLPTHDVPKMEQALLAQVARFQETPVSAKELAKAKNQLSTRELRKIQTLGGVAYQLGRSTYVLGDPQSFRTEVNRLDLVTASDIQRVARQYLKESNLSLLRMDRVGQRRRRPGAPPRARRPAASRKGGAR